jgi:hypothetical protein
MFIKHTATNDPINGIKLLKKTIMCCKLILFYYHISL